MKLPVMTAGNPKEFQALAKWCEEQVPQFQGPVSFHKFHTGQSNPTYRVATENGSFVLRTKPPGQLLRSAHAVDREYRVMKALDDTNVPVPKVIAMCNDDSSPIGRAFFVMEMLEGRIFWDPALREMDMSIRKAIYAEMNKTLAALHDVDVAEVGLSDFGKPGNYFARQIERWTQQYLSSTDNPATGMLEMCKYLQTNQPNEHGAIALVHGDYRLDNMIFANDRARVIGLIDWELSTLGHPIADLAYQCMQWRLPHGGEMRGLGGLNRIELGLPDEAAYVDEYLHRRGLSSIDNWSFYIVFSFFRLIAILEGVVSRARKGNASNPATARTYQTVLPQLIDLAMDEMATA